MSVSVSAMAALAASCLASAVSSFALVSSTMASEDSSDMRTAARSASLVLSLSLTDTSGAIPEALSLLAASSDISASPSRSLSSRARDSVSWSNLDATVSARVRASMASRCIPSSLSRSADIAETSASSAITALARMSLAASLVTVVRSSST